MEPTITACACRMRAAPGVRPVMRHSRLASCAVGTSWRRRRGRLVARAGQATVEFTLVTLIMLPLVLGAIEIGRGVWYYNQISSLSREGARWIIVTAAEGGTDHSRTGNTPGTYTLN